MNEYIFRMPEGTPDLTFGSLQELLRGPGGGTAKIGTTVEITAESMSPASDKPAIALRLYGLLIARIARDSVWFPATGDAHVATSYWLAKIVSDNGLGHNVWRIRRHKSDGQGSPVPRGYAGLLTIDGDRGKPVEGHGYPVPAKTGETAVDEAKLNEAASDIAGQITDAARGSGDDPIAWVTGNAYMPPLRSFTAAEQVWQADEDGEDFAWLVELVEAKLSDAEVALECPDYDNALYAVDLRRFEYVDDPGDHETLQQDWKPRVCESCGCQPGELVRDESGEPVRELIQRDSHGKYASDRYGFVRCSHEGTETHA